jgi:hypothetical protein
MKLAIARVFPLDLEDTARVNVAVAPIPIMMAPACLDLTLDLAPARLELTLNLAATTCVKLTLD